jgi:hypothetical protein
VLAVLEKLHDRLTYANVMSTVGVFIALGGSSIAAVSLTRGSVQGKHVARDAITSPKVKNRSLLAADFAQGQLPQGEKGDKGDPGTPGTAGEPGAPGSPAASMVIGNSTGELGAGQAAFSDLSPSGASALSGSDLNRAQASPNVPIVVRDLAVVQTIASGANGNFRYRLLNLSNGSEILLSCSIAGTTDKSCDSGSQSASVAAKSRLVIEVGQLGTGASTGVFPGWGFRATTP